MRNTDLDTIASQWANRLKVLLNQLVTAVKYPIPINNLFGSCHSNSIYSAGILFDFGGFRCDHSLFLESGLFVWCVPRLNFGRSPDCVDDRLDDMHDEGYTNNETPFGQQRLKEISFEIAPMNRFVALTFGVKRPTKVGATIPVAELNAFTTPINEAA